MRGSEYLWQKGYTFTSKQIAFKRKQTHFIEQLAKRNRTALPVAEVSEESNDGGQLAGAEPQVPLNRDMWQQWLSNLKIGEDKLAERAVSGKVERVLVQQEDHDTGS